MRWRIAVSMIVCAALAATVSWAQDQKQPQADTAQQGAPHSTPEIVRIGGNVAAANVIHTVQPIYPAIAKTAHIQGTVLLHALIAKNGSVKHLTFVSGPPLLMRSAMDAVKQWRYKPTLLNGNPVEVDTTITVIFTLGGAPKLIPVEGEQVSLKDGTKIVGKVTALDGDTFTVQTSFSKMQIPRTQILSITFSENGQTTPPVTTIVPRAVDQSISGGVYTNGTGHFTLTVPDGWQPSDALARKVSGAIGAVTAPDRHEMVIIQTLPAGGTAKEEVQILESTFQSSFEGFEKLSESSDRIDGVEADMISFRAIIAIGNVRTQGGTDEPADTTIKAPIKYLVVVLPEPSETVMLMCVAPDALYAQSEPTFRQIVASFHSTAPKPESASPPKY
ncbi:MAG: energy transducer TonB [Candidatus Acidiferrales bacterium]